MNGVAAGRDHARIRRHEALVGPARVHGSGGRRDLEVIVDVGRHGFTMPRPGARLSDLLEIGIVARLVEALERRQNGDLRQAERPDAEKQSHRGEP